MTMIDYLINWSMLIDHQGHKIVVDDDLDGGNVHFQYVIVVVGSGVDEDDDDIHL